MKLQLNEIQKTRERQLCDLTKDRRPSEKPKKTGSAKTESESQVDTPISLRVEDEQATNALKSFQLRNERQFTTRERSESKYEAMSLKTESESEEKDPESEFLRGKREKPEDEIRRAQEAGDERTANEEDKAKEETKRKTAIDIPGLTKERGGKQREEMKSGIQRGERDGLPKRSINEDKSKNRRQMREVDEEGCEALQEAYPAEQEISLTNQRRKLIWRQTQSNESRTEKRDKRFSKHSGKSCTNRL
jgi:hypothetical protein